MLDYYNMRLVKQIVVFLLVVVTIYWTMLFYLLMSVHADTRLQEIDYLQKTKPEGSGKVLYIDKLVPLTDRLTYFSISRVSHKTARPLQCPPQTGRRALLIVSGSGFDPLTIYSKLLRQLQVGVDGCGVPQVYVLKRLRPLILNNEETINKYAFEIGEIIKYFTIEAECELSIFTHEEGALLTLTYLARRTINLLFTNIVEKIRTILLVDLAHPFIRVQYDPPYKLLAKLKREVINHPDRTNLFNKLRFVIVTTHRQDPSWQHYQLAFGQPPFVFARTVLISSREMANVHYFLPPNSLSFPPLVRRLGHFLAKDFMQTLSNSQVSAFLKHGQSYEYQKIEAERVHNCEHYSLDNKSILKVVRDQCITLTPIPLEEDDSILLYAADHFEVYSDTLEKVYPFDNLTEGSLYMFQKLDEELHILNPQEVEIYISKQIVASPKHPLPLSEVEVAASSQLIFSNYSLLRICPNLLLTFPLHFAQGNFHRTFLGAGESNCYTQSSMIEQFSWQFFLQWTLIRNMIIFTMSCSIFMGIEVSDRLLEQFLINFVVLVGRDEIQNKLANALYIMAFGLLVEYGCKVVLYLCSHITLKQKWASFVLLGISAICLFGSVFNFFNYWRIFLFAVIFFLNGQNLSIFLIKLYFLKEEILFSSSQFMGLADLGLLTMWLYTSLAPTQPPPTVASQWPAEKIFSGLLVAVLGVSLDSSGSFVETVITIYMKVMVVLRMLKIIRK